MSWRRNSAYYPAGHPPDRKGNECAYCSCPIPTKLMTRDHLIPKKLGGELGRNLVLACQLCNQAKGDELLPGIEEPEKRGPGGHTPSRVDWGTLRAAVAARRALAARKPRPTGFYRPGGGEGALGSGFE